MIGILSSIIISLIVIGVLVIVHEFGHFIVAKKCGVWVEEFAVGMGKKICSKQIGETEYSLRLFPLGGFCPPPWGNRGGRNHRTLFPGEVCMGAYGNHGCRPNHELSVGDHTDFWSVASGYIIQPKVAAVLDGSPAQEIGLQEGDEIYRINGDRIHIYDEMQAIMLQNGGEPIDLEIKRDGMIY